MVYEKRGDYRFYFAYDAMGNLAEIIRINPAGTVYTCFVLCNSRGDVVGLRNYAGTVLAKYTYDSWGKLLSITDGNGTIFLKSFSRIKSGTL